MTTDTLKETEAYKQARRDFVQVASNWWENWLQVNKSFMSLDWRVTLGFSITQFIKEIGGESDPWAEEIRKKLED